MRSPPLVPAFVEALSRRAFLMASAAATTTVLAACALPPTITIINPETSGVKKEEDMSAASEHYTLSTDEGEAVWFLGTLATIKASGALTEGAFSLVEFLHPPGFATLLHVHHNEDEAFFVVEGAIEGMCGDDRWYAGFGSFVWLPRGVPHGYVVIGDEPVRTLALAIPSGFDRFVVEAGDPAQSRTLPPPSEPNFERLAAASAKYGIETFGPLVLP